MQANKLYILQINKTNNSSLFLELSWQHWLIWRIHKVGNKQENKNGPKNRGRGVSWILTLTLLLIVNLNKNILTIRNKM